MLRKTVEMVVDFRKNPAPPTPINLRLPSRHCGVLPLSGHHHLPGPQVGAKHQLPHQKSSTEDVLPAAAEEVQPAKGNNGALLNLHHRVHPQLLHHRLVHTHTHTHTRSEQ